MTFRINPKSSFWTKFNRTIPMTKRSSSYNRWDTCFQTYARSYPSLKPLCVSEHAGLHEHDGTHDPYSSSASTGIQQQSWHSGREWREALLPSSLSIDVHVSKRLCFWQNRQLKDWNGFSPLLQSQWCPGLGSVLPFQKNFAV